MEKMLFKISDGVGLTRIREPNSDTNTTSPNPQDTRYAAQSKSSSPPSSYQSCTLGPCTEQRPYTSANAQADIAQKHALKRDTTVDDRADYWLNGFRQTFDVGKLAVNQEQRCTTFEQLLLQVQKLENNAAEPSISRNVRSAVSEPLPKQHQRQNRSQACSSDAFASALDTKVRKRKSRTLHQEDMKRQCKETDKLTSVVLDSDTNYNYPSPPFLKQLGNPTMAAMVDSVMLGRISRLPSIWHPKLEPLPTFNLQARLQMPVGTCVLDGSSAFAVLSVSRFFEDNWVDYSLRCEMGHCDMRSSSDDIMFVERFNPENVQRRHPGKTQIHYLALRMRLWATKVDIDLTKFMESWSETAVRNLLAMLHAYAKWPDAKHSLRPALNDMCTSPHAGILGIELAIGPKNIQKLHSQLKQKMQSFA